MQCCPVRMWVDKHTCHTIIKQFFRCVSSIMMQSMTFHVPDQNIISYNKIMRTQERVLGFRVQGFRKTYFFQGLGFNFLILDIGDLTRKLLVNWFSVNIENAVILLQNEISKILHLIAKNWIKCFPEKNPVKLREIFG